MSKIVLDIETDREAGRVAPLVAAGLVTCMVIMGHVLQPEDSAYLWVGGLGVVSCIGAFVFWRMLSEYYELTEEGELEFVRVVGKSETRNSLGPIAETIKAVVVQNWMTRHAGLMSLALVDKDAKVLPLEHYRLRDGERVDMPFGKFDDMLMRGQELSEAIGIPFQCGAEGEHASVKKVNGEVEVQYTSESPLRSLTVVIVFALIALPLAYFALSRYTDF